MKLFISAITKFLFGAVLLGVMLFLPAGTLCYSNGWLFLGVLFVPMLILGAVMLIKSPELLKKRLNGKEKQKAQRGVVALSGLTFPAGFILSALDFRLGWSDVPMWLALTAAAVFISGYGLYAEVMRENAYLSRIIEVQQGQRVIDTGLYGIVRHPMYFATLLMFLPIPLILGSLWGLIPFVLYVPLIVTRILNEEAVLKKELHGYEEYTQRIKYRLIPFIW